MIVAPSGNGQGESWGWLMSDDVVTRQDRWVHRRRRLDIAIGTHVSGIGYLIGWGADNALHRSIAEGLILSMASLLLGYIIAPVADDWLQRRAGP